MARKNRLSKAARTIARTARRLTPSGKDARTVAEAALGAAAIAATGVVAKKAADAVRDGNGQVAETVSGLQRRTAKAVSLPPFSKRRKHAAAGRQLRSKRKNTKPSRSAKRRASSR